MWKIDKIWSLCLNAAPWHYATSVIFHFDVITLQCGASIYTELEYSAD